MFDTCLLCKERKVYYINSHLTPAGITENTYGPRNYEHIFTIDPQEKKIDEYYGRNHPQSEITEIKNEPNSRKGIFCKICEDNLGVYESAVQAKLNIMINSIGRGAIINKTKLGIKYLDIDILPNILITYFKSVVWRQCLEQTLNGMDNPLNSEQFESLRKQVLENITIPIKEMRKKGRILSPKMSIFTSYNTKQIASHANPHSDDTNPLIFFIGPVVLQFWLTKEPSNNFNNVTKIDEKLLDENLTLDKSKLAIVNEGKWIKIQYVISNELANQFHKS